MKLTGVVAALVLLLSGCAGMLAGDPIDIPAMEREIERGYHEQTDISADVTCPSEREWETGESFRCEIDGGDYGSTLVTVYMESDDEWFWQVG